MSKGTELVHPHCERDCRVRIVGKSVVPGELSETVTTPHRVARKKKKKKKKRKEKSERQEKKERCKETNSQQNKKDKGGR